MCAVCVCAACMVCLLSVCLLSGCACAECVYVCVCCVFVCVFVCAAVCVCVAPASKTWLRMCACVPNCAVLVHVCTVMYCQLTSSVSHLVN